MLTRNVIELFGSKVATARALGISPQAVGQWPEVVPVGRAYQLQVITAGRLAVDPAAYRHRPRQNGSTEQ